MRYLASEITLAFKGIEGRFFAGGIFQPCQAINALLDGHETLLVRQVLNAGFCAWLIDPSDQDFIRGYMICKTALLLHKSERKVGPSSEPDVNRQVLEELVVRFLPKTQRLLVDCFYPLGGLIGLANADSPKTYKQRLRKRAERVEGTATLVGYMHLQKEQLKEFGPPSVNKACALFRALHKPMVQRTSVMRMYWTEMQPTALWVYAASRLSDGNGRSLLSLITTSEATHKRVSPLIPELISRTVFIRNFLSSSRKQQTGGFSIPLPEKVKPVSFSPPPLSDDEIQAARDVLRTYHAT